MTSPVELFRNIMPTMELQYKIAMDICLDAGLEHKWQALKLMHDGGPCPICSEPFRLRVGGNVPKENRVDLFFYWMPACKCFPVCHRCGSVMIEERLEGIDWCRNCQYGPKAKKPRKRAESILSGKDKAAGEKE